MESLEDSLALYKGSLYSSDSIQGEGISSYEAMIQREVKNYRLKYFCCSQSCSKIWRYMKLRCLHGTEVYLALFLLFLERAAYFAVTGNVIDPFLKYFDNVPPVYRALIQTAIFQASFQLMFPIAGFLGDRFIGRFRTAHISLWLLLFGYAMLTFVSSFEPSYDKHHESDNGSQANRYLLPVCFVIITMGSGGFQANMIPFGADQIIGRPSDEISAYFFWYYWVRNVGSIVAALSLLCLFNYSSTVFGFVSTLSISLALIVVQLTQHRFFIDKQRYNPLKLVYQVVKFAATVKRPIWRSAFSYTGVDAPSRIDLAKEVHGGWFTNVEVEDVKTFLRLLVFMVSMIGVLIVYAGVVNVISTQVKHMNGSFAHPTQNHCAYSESSVWILNIGVIIIFIPFLNFCLYPLVRDYMPNMQKRIGIGHILALSSPTVLLTLSAIGVGMLRLGPGVTQSCMFESSEHHHHRHILPINSHYVILPHITISLAEVLVIVSSLEFFYAQSPHTMRGMMIGLFFFTWGISTVIANLLVVFFSNITVGVLTCGIWYYILLTLFAIIALVLFLCVSCWYQNRMRGDIPPDKYYRL